MFRAVLQVSTLIAIVGVTLFLFEQTDAPTIVHNPLPQPKPVPIQEEQPPATDSEATTTKPVDPNPKPSNIRTQTQAEPPPPTTSVPEPDTTIVTRPENTYNTPPQDLETVNTNARLALVNILCETASGSFNPISGSGTIIDPQGVVLTNAHVAQYLLLSTRPEFRLSCTIRMGSPARPKYKASILFMPEQWLTEHAMDIRSTSPMGTGEHDYALLIITGTTDGSPLPSQFPHIPVDTREGIGFAGDDVVVAAYPAEFSGGITTQMNLYASSAITRIRELMTFTDRPIDVLTLGGVILAQSGSSGGAVVNAWGRLVGVVTTTSPGATTGERDLRAITLSYIDRALYRDAGVGLATILSSNLRDRNVRFMDTQAPALVQLLINEL